MPSSLLAVHLLACLLLPVLVQSQVRSPPGVHPGQYDEQHGQGHQGSRQYLGEGHQQQQYQGQPAQQRYQGQQAGGQRQNQNIEGQARQYVREEGVPSYEEQDQVLIRDLDAGQGEVPEYHSQEHVPSQEYKSPPRQQQQVPDHQPRDQDRQYVDSAGQEHQAKEAGRSQQAERQHGQHQGGHGHGQQRVLHKDIGHEKEHMKEHLEVPMDTSKMSDQELQFHYFKMHDTDGNNKLDGCELVKSLIHWHASDDSSHHHGDDEGHSKTPPKIFEDNELAVMIDPVLVSDDRNKDGFIDYYEFIAAQNAQVKASS